MRRKVYAVLACLLFLNKSERLVWIDETGFRTHMTRTRGWSKRGCRVRFACRQRSTPYTMVCAMGYDKIVCKWVFPGSLDAKRWRQFIQDKLMSHLEPGRIVLWDNLNIHQDRTLIQHLHQAGHFVVFTPPYSPEGNPIEYMFSKLKIFVRQQCPRGAASLRRAIDLGLETITAQNIASYFTAAYKYVLTWR